MEKKRNWYGLSFKCPVCGSTQRKQSQRGKIEHKCNGCKQIIIITVTKQWDI
jgi:transcription elongation factor Elf1